MNPNAVVTQVEDNFVFMMVVEEEPSDEEGVRKDKKVSVNAVALNLDVPRDNTVNHDTGATRHIFHDQNSTSFDMPSLALCRVDSE